MPNPTKFKIMDPTDGNLQASVEPPSGVDASDELNQRQPSANHSGIPANLGEWLPTLNRVDAITSARELARELEVSDTSINKWVKSLQQAIPEHWLKNEKGLTEVSTYLIDLLQKRPEAMSIAEWVNELKTALSGMDADDYTTENSETLAQQHHERAEELQAESSALALRNSDLLSNLTSKCKALNRSKKAKSAAELDAIAQQAYRNKLLELSTIYEAEAKAEADFEAALQGDD
jgi:Sec-independent protein translocase protein TatA